MAKSLFNDDYTYSEEALIALKEIDSFHSRIFKEYIRKGYSPRDIGSIMYSSVGCLEAENTILLGIQKRKEKRRNENG